MIKKQPTKVNIKNPKKITIMNNVHNIYYGYLNLRWYLINFKCSFQKLRYNFVDFNINHNQFFWYELQLILRKKKQSGCEYIIIFFDQQIQNKEHIHVQVRKSIIMFIH